MYDKLNDVGSSNNDIGTDRSFGLVFAVFFTVLYGWHTWHGDPNSWFLVSAVAFLGVALGKPTLLHPLNVLWFRFGLLLHKVMSPVILGAIFFGVLTPMALLMRILGKRPLHLDAESSASSYWVERVPPGPEAESFRNQF